MLETLRTLMLVGIGAAELTEARIQAALADLVKRGELAERDARTLAAEWLDRHRTRQQASDTHLAEQIATALDRHEVARLSELRALEAKVERLERRLRDVSSVNA